MLWTWFKNQQIEHQKLRFAHSRIFNFTFIIELWAKMSLSKHKSHNYATAQMVYWLSSWSSKLGAQVRIPPVAIFIPFFQTFFSLQTDTQYVCLLVFELYRLFLCIKIEARAKQYRSVRHCYNMTCSVCNSATIVRILLQY